MKHHLLFLMPLIIMPFLFATTAASVTLINNTTNTTQPSRAELAPTPIIYPNSIVEGMNVFFDSGIINNGTADTRAFNIKWYVDNVMTGYGSHKGIKAGETALNGNSQYTWKATAGTHTIRFVVDADRHIPETNEYNNQATVTAAVPPKSTSKPDLTVSQININTLPDENATGTTAKINITLKNIGIAEAQPSLLDIKYSRIGENRSIIWRFFIGKLNIETNQTIPMSINLLPGEYTLTATADAGNTIAELNENNNNMTKTFRIDANQQNQTRLPDLTITNMTFTPPNPTTNDTIKINITVKNAGTATAGASKLSISYISASYDVPELTPGASHTKEITAGRLSAGTRTFTATADSFWQLTELNETNNELTRILNVTNTTNSNTGRLFATSTPSGAEFWTTRFGSDETQWTFHGLTPITTQELPAQSYILKWNKTGYTDYTIRNVAAEPGIITHRHGGLLLINHTINYTTNFTIKPFPTDTTNYTINHTFPKSPTLPTNQTEQKITNHTINYINYTFPTNLTINPIINPEPIIILSQANPVAQ